MAVESEIRQLKQKLESDVGGHFEILTADVEIVQIKFKISSYRILTCVAQIPKSYPDDELLIELKSKYFSPVLVKRLTVLVEGHLKKEKGSYSLVSCFMFVWKMLRDQPLLVIKDDLDHAKKKLLSKFDEMTFNQKKGIIFMTIKTEASPYSVQLSLTVPPDYPESQIKIEKKEHSFPASICYYMVCNANEIARRRVEPPRSKRANPKSFSPQPHLTEVLKFLVSETGHRYPKEECVLCKKQAFNEDPKDVERNPKADLFVTRLYCGHIFHYKCLNGYMTKPPFKNFEGGKKCPWEKCNNRVFHDKWAVSPEILEKRWGKKMEDNREIFDMEEFLYG